MINLNPTKTKQQRKKQCFHNYSDLWTRCQIFVFFWGRVFLEVLVRSWWTLAYSSATSHRVELGAAIFGASDLQRQRHRPCSQNAHLFIYFCLVFKIYLSVHASLEFNKLAMNENSSLDVPSFINRNYTQSSIFICVFRTFIDVVHVLQYIYIYVIHIVSYIYIIDGYRINMIKISHLSDPSPHQAPRVAPPPQAWLQISLGTRII